ncbi:MAG: hypothetical protein LC808_31800 [Actinobacteria bacterium]|nr:hypothetical protein [Actinomycetota bacterium]
MNLDQDIRTMLRERAEGVAAAPTVPHTTLRRVRVRKTLMTGSVAAVAAALVFGGFAASRSLSNDAAPIRPADETTEEDPTVDGVSLDTTFVSPRNGYSIKHPERVAITPAKQLWGEFSKQVDDGFDVVETGLGAVFKGTSTMAILDGEGSADEQFDENLSAYLPGGCGVPRSQQAEIRIDGQPGRITECENRIEANVVAGAGRVYLFILEHDRSDARAVFDAFAATIDLTPETGVDFPAMTTTFVSPTYGYSFRYFDRGEGSLALATKLWDPVNHDLSANDVFDGWETGLGAYFAAASTEIPDGVSIDEWVDEYVSDSPGGCGVPRSQQVEITIDGQPGRIAECDHSEATVVAGGRLYLFTGPADDRGWFDAWVDTIDLTPETAAVPRYVPREVVDSP